MPIKLSKAEQEFRKPLIAHFDAKAINLDRMLVNLFMLIKHDGQRPIANKSRGDVKLPTLYDRLVRDQHYQQGLDAYPDVIQKWLASDLVDMVYRGVQGKEAVAAPMPLNLDAYKLRNVKHTRDFNSSDQAYSLLRYGDPNIIGRLRECFGDEENVVPGSLDMNTLVVKRLLSGTDLNDITSTDSREPLAPPLSLAAARLLANDVQRLLAYQGMIPRHVLLDYLKIILGMHMGLYMLRLFALLPGWVKTRQIGGECEYCQGLSKDDPLAPCLYQPLLFVDMGDDYKSTAAELSQASVRLHFARINDYVKAVFTVNQLLFYLNNDYKRTGPQASIEEALATYRNPPGDFDPMFKIRVNQLFQELEKQQQEAEHQTNSARKQMKEQSQWSEIDAIRTMNLFSPFETFIEVVAYIRTPFHQRYHVELLDSLFQKNSDGGLLRSGRARNNARRFHIGSRLLEVLVQIAVLEQDGDNGYRSRTILIDELVSWLLQRYGLVINGQDVPEIAKNDGVRELSAYKDNLFALKDRLREIGFYTDLSDAYNAQTIRPRYSLEGVNDHQYRK